MSGAIAWVPQSPASRIRMAVRRAAVRARIPQIDRGLAEVEESIVEAWPRADNCLRELARRSGA